MGYDSCMAWYYSGVVWYDSNVLWYDSFAEWCHSGVMWYDRGVGWYERVVGCGVTGVWCPSWECTIQLNARKGNIILFFKANQSRNQVATFMAVLT